ncbi:MAG: hypothetical protein ACU0BS_12740 [Hasllibacter sp.]
MDGSNAVEVILLMDDVVVAGDIAELLRSRRPGITVDHRRDLADVAGLMGRRRPAVVVSAFPIQQMRAAGLDAAAEGAGTRIVVLNGHESAADKAGTGWSFVARPFTEDLLLEAVLPAGR